MVLRKQLVSFILFLMCLVPVIGCSQTANFKDLQGHPVQLKNLQNKWLVLNYWAGWCDSCLNEIPELNKFYQHTKDKDVLFYGVNYDELVGDKLQQAVRDAGIAFPVLTSDPNGVLWQFGDIEVLPVTYIINPQGKVVGKIEGASTEKSLMGSLDTLRKKKL